MATRPYRFPGEEPQDRAGLVSDRRRNSRFQRRMGKRSAVPESGRNQLLTLNGARAHELLLASLPSAISTT